MKITTIGSEYLILPEIRNATGESPVWDSLEKCWKWIDQIGKIYCFDPKSGVAKIWTSPEKIGSMVLSSNGGMVCSCESGIFDVTLGQIPEAVTKRLASISHPQPGMRFNDGRCDRQGRLWVSTMVMDISLGAPAGRWFRYTQETGLEASSHDGFIIPNGSAFSPDGKIFYCSDTHRDKRVLWAFDYDIDSGTLSNKRLFADLKNETGRPDGAAVDTDGCYWVCGLDDGSMMRFTPKGIMDQKFILPMQKPTMCSFGGEDGKTMLVTSLCRGENDLQTDPNAGRLMMFNPGFQGIAEPRLQMN